MKDKFIRENNEKKALKLAYKQLLKKISDELVKEHRTFGKIGKSVLVLGKNHIHLLFAVLEHSLDGDPELDMSDVDLFDLEKSEIKIWSRPVYVSSQDDVIEVVASMGSLIDHPFIEHIIEKKDGSYIDALDMDVLIAKLPESAKFKEV